MDRASMAKAGTMDQARRTIRIGLAMLGAALLILLAGIFWFGMPAVFEFNSPDFIPIPGFFAFAIAVFGAIQLGQGLLQSARFGKYGASILEAAPAVLGQVFRGKIRTDRPLEVSGPYTIRLFCEAKDTSDDSSDSNRASRNRALLWEATVAAPASTRSSIGIPFQFLIPADGIPNRAGSAVKEHEIYWTLSASAPMAGLHYRAEFPIDVGATDAETEEEEVEAARRGPASLKEAFVGQPRPQRPALRILGLVTLIVGLLLFGVGAYSTFLQWSHGQNGVTLSGKITAVDRPALDVVIEGGSSLRVSRVTKNNIWQIGQPVQITCLPDGREFRSCRMDTGSDRWIDAIGTLAVGILLLLLGGWLRSR